jgi:hypothetical protein
MPQGSFTKIPFAIRKKMGTIWRKEHPSVPEHGGYSLSQIRRCFQVLVPVTVAPNVTDPETDRFGHPKIRDRNTRMSLIHKATTGKPLESN